MKAITRPILFLMLSATTLTAQRVLQETEAVELALKNSPAVQAAELQAQQSGQQQKAAFNLPNPDVMAESPTGEFYTIGVQQSLEFPTVYFQQGRLQKERTALAQTEHKLTEAEIAYRVRSIYVNLQYQIALVAVLHKQDSVFEALNNAAKRNHAAGSIDVIQKTSAETQYGQVHIIYLQAQADEQLLMGQLQLYTGLTEAITVPSLNKAGNPLVGQILFPDTNALRSNLRLQYFDQMRNVSQRTLRVERHRMLPGITFGYLNQGPLNTPMFYRFRAGVTVPLWFWQYSGNIRAAKLGVRISQQQYLAQEQTLSAELMQARNDVSKTLAALSYYETSGLTNAQTLISATQRFFDSGEIEYTNHMRTMNDAYGIERSYLDALRDYNHAVLRLSYLNAK